MAVVLHDLSLAARGCDWLVLLEAGRVVADGLPETVLNMANLRRVYRVNVMAITGGIAEALIATATGLCVALLTLLPYNYFRAKVERLTERMEEQATRLEHCLSRRVG